MLAFALAFAVAVELKPPVEHASADDCAIIVAIGRAQLGWNERTPPSQDFYPEWDSEKGGTYIQDCPWRDHGVAPPHIGGNASAASFSIARPRYDRARSTATAELTVALSAEGRPPFVSAEQCTARRQGRRWVVVGCRQTAIT